MKSSSSFVSAGLLASACFLLAGCESGPDRHSMEQARRSVPTLAGDETFFDGKLAAHVKLGSSLADTGGAPDKASGGKGKGAGGGHMHGGGRGGHGMGGMGGGGGEHHEAYEGEDSDTPQAHYVDSPMPPALLRVRLENTSAEAIVVEIRDLNSELGNFATRPDKFTLEPGASDEPTAMQSLLGVDSMALPVTLTLRAGGKTETKVVTLRPVTPPTPPPPAPPAAN